MCKKVVSKNLEKMEEKEEIPLKLICMACLCVGRRLRNITDEKLKRFYLETLNDIQLCLAKIDLRVCWECEALFKKIVQFREQVKDSYRILQTYSSENPHVYLLSDIVRSPRLGKKTISVLSISPKLRTAKGFKEEVKIEWDKRGINEDSDGLPPDSDNVDALDVEIETLVSKANENKQRNGLKSLEICPLSDVSPSLHCTASPIVVETQFITYDVKVEDEVRESSINPIKTSGIPLEVDDADVDPFEAEIETLVPKAKKKKNKIKSKINKTKKVVKKLQNGMKTSKKVKKLDDQKIITIELSYEEMLVEREREVERDSYINAAYKCDTCLIRFNYKHSYKAHMSAKHSPNGGNYECPICKSNISSVDSFTAHYKRHLRRYECSICQKRTMDIKVMQQHYYSTHEISLKEYKCDICGKISNSIDTHRYHKDTHKARVQCTECDKTFTHRAGLLNHRLTVHELNNAFPCTFCDKVFRWKTSLKRHLEKHDVKDKCSAAYCGVCGITFSSVCSYQRHMRNSLRHVSHDQLRYICDHCKRRFADKTKLRDHIEEKHLHRTYQCHICLKPSKNRVGLDQHIRNVHKGRPNNKLCHHCGKGFPTKVQLESHIRTHTGERPFACDYCPTTFSQLSNLYKHNRQVHSNVKAKRYPPCKKKKEEKPPDPPTEAPVDPYRPVAVLHYSTERGFVM